MWLNWWDSRFDFEPLEQEEIHPEIESTEIEWIKVYMLASKNSRAPEEENTVVFAVWWSRTFDSTAPLIREFSNVWRDVITLDHPRFWWAINSNPTDIDIPDELLRRATSISQVIKAENNIEWKSFDLVWQSLWAIDSVIAALMLERDFPWIVDSLVLVNPAWSIDVDTNESVHHRFKKFQMPESLNLIKQGVANAELARSKGRRYYVTNIIRAKNELAWGWNINLKELLQILKNDTNINVSIIQWVDDQTYPLDMIQKQERNIKGDWIPLAEVINSYQIVDWGHNNIYYKPKEFARIVGDTLWKNEKMDRELCDLDETKSLIQWAILKALSD